MKGLERTAEFEAVLRNLLGRVPFLKLETVRRDSNVADGAVDLLLETKVGNRRRILVVEAKRLGHPREIRIALLQLQSYLAKLPGKARYYGLVAAPFISQESALLCADAGIGYADLAGNARLSFDHVFIETRASDNPLRERREQRSLFAPRAARVLRVLLQGPLRAWKVAELAHTARVSLGWASTVRQQLLSREWAVEEAAGIRVSKPGAVLDAWARSDKWEERTATQQYSLLVSGDPVLLAKKVQKILQAEQPAFTRWFAASLRHPYATTPTITAYVRKFPERRLIEETFLARPVPNGGTLELVLPKDEGVFQPTQTMRGLSLVSDVQIYLDLLQAGQRGDEQAAELRKWPDFAGGWQ